MVSIYTLMVNCAINAIKDREVVTCDIPGVFLQSDWLKDKPIYLKFHGVIMNIFCEIDPSLGEYIVNTRSGRKLMYGNLSKVVYGTLRDHTILLESGRSIAGLGFSNEFI